MNVKYKYQVQQIQKYKYQGQNLEYINVMILYILSDRGPHYPTPLNRTRFRVMMLLLFFCGFVQHISIQIRVVLFNIFVFKVELPTNIMLVWPLWVKKHDWEERSHKGGSKFVMSGFPIGEAGNVASQVL